MAVWRDSVLVEEVSDEGKVHVVVLLAAALAEALDESAREGAALELLASFARETLERVHDVESADGVLDGVREGLVVVAEEEVAGAVVGAGGGKGGAQVARDVGQGVREG